MVAPATLALPSPISLAFFPPSPAPSGDFVQCALLAFLWAGTGTHVPVANGGHSLI